MYFSSCKSEESCLCRGTISCLTCIRNNPMIVDRYKIDEEYERERLRNAFKSSIDKLRGE